MQPYIILLSFVCSLTLVMADAGEIPLKYQIDGYKEFESLSKNAALKKSIKLAESDFNKGIYRIFVFGKRRIDNPDEKYLQEHYAIYTIPIAGCIVTDGILGAAEGYNQTMKTLLLNKFKKDVFKESKEKTEQGGASNILPYWPLFDAPV